MKKRISILRSNHLAILAIFVLAASVLVGVWAVLADPPTTPVGRWPMDEGSGTNTVDVSTNGNHGVLIGSPAPVWTSGVSSNALSFDGVQNEIQIADVPVLTPTNAFTLAAWVKAATNLTSEAIGKWSTSEPDGSYILGLTNGWVVLELSLAGQYTALVGQAASLSSTNWHHIVGSYDGSQMRVYLDGSLVGSQSATGTVDVVTDPLRVGLIAGRMDDARLYDQALSTNEVAAIYNTDSDGDGIPDYWEANNGLNPNDSADGSADIDGDGFSNLQEYLAGTNPLSASSRPVRVWTGAASAQWNNANNWSPAGVPTSGDTLVFDGSATGNFSNTNNLTGLSVAELRVLSDGYTLAGNALTNNGLVNLNLVQPGTSTVAVAMSGTGTVTKLSSGVIKLSGVNTYTGGTMVNGGTLLLDLSARTGNYSLYAFTVANGANLTFSNTLATIDGTYLSNTSLSGAGTFTKTGVGYVDFWSGSSLSGFTGTLDVQGGTLAVNGLGANANAGQATLNLGSSGTFDLRNNSVLQVNRLTGSGTFTHSYTDSITLTVGSSNGDSAFDGVITRTSGTLALVKTGAGVFTLTGTNNTYNGNLTINGGTLSVASLGAINGSSSGWVAVQQGGAFRYTGTGAESRSGLLYWNSGAGVIDVTNAAANLTFVITGGTRNYQFTKAGAGQLTLSKTTAINELTANPVLITGGTLEFNQNNTGAISRFSGVVTGAAGTQLKVTGTGYVGNESLTANWSANLASLDVGSGARFDLRGNQVTIDALTGAGTVTNSNYRANSGIIGETLAVGANNGSGIFSGAIVGTNTTTAGSYGRISLTKIGSGTQTLSGVNTYSGPTTISNGTLLVIGSITGTGLVTVVNGAALGGSGTINGAVTASGTITPGTTMTPGRLTLNAGYTQTTNGTFHVRLGDTNSFDNVSVGSAANLAGSLVVELVNGYTPTTNTTFRILSASTRTGQFATNSLPALPANTYWNVAYDATGMTLEVLGPVLYFTSEPMVKSIANAGLQYTDSLAANVFDSVTGDGLSFAKLSGPAWLTVASNGVLGGAPAVSDGGTNSFLVSVFGTPSGLSTTGTVHVVVNDTASTSGIALTQATTWTVSDTNTFVQSGVISGTGPLIKDGTGTLSLAGANTYSGGTVINNGLLQLAGGNDRLPTTGSVTFGGGTLSLNGYNQTIGSLSGTGTILLGSGTLTINQTVNGSFAGQISGAGGTLMKAGNAVLTLSGTNTYTGATILSGGTLQLASDNLLSASSNIVFGGAATLDLSATSQALANLTVNSGVTGTVVGSGALVLNSGKNLVVASGVSATLDLAGLGTLVYNNPTNFVMMVASGGNGTVKLAQNNEITAAEFDVVTTSGSVNTYGTVSLGQSNRIYASTVKVGVGNSGLLHYLSGTVNFQTGLTNPVVTLRGTTGGDSRADITVGSVLGSDYGSGNSTIDLSAGVIDAKVGTLKLGQYKVQYNNQNHYSFGNFLMGEGVLDATTMVLGQAFDDGYIHGYQGVASGVFTLDGGTVTVQTMTLGDNHTIDTLTGTFNLKNGVLRAQTIQPGLFSATRLLNWDNGTISTYGVGTNLTITGVVLDLGGGNNAVFHTGAGTITLTNVTSTTATGTVTKVGTGILTLIDSTLGGSLTVVDGRTELTIATIASDLVVTNSVLAVLPDREVPGGSSIMGNFSQNAASELQLEFGSAASYGGLTVGASASLGGTLTVQLANDYAPLPGDSFRIIQAGSVTGQFATVILPTLIVGEWEISYDATGVTLSVGGVAVTDDDALTGSQTTTNQLGQWTVEGNDIYAADRRGAVEYNVTASAADVYRLAIEGAQNIAGSSSATFELILSVDGVSLGRYTLVAPVGSTGTVYALTPYLSAGNHTVRIFWDNAASYTSLRIKSVKLQSIAGDDANGNGIKDWVEDLLTSANSILTASTSYVSPAFVEGKGAFRDAMSVSANVGGTATNLVISPAPNQHWFTNVPLTTNAASSVVVSYENGGLVQTQQVTWAATDVLATSNLTIRAGDSLLVIAGAGATNGTSTITIGTNQYATTPPIAVPYLFQSPGTNTVTGIYNNGTQAQTNSISVKVVGGGFNGNPICWLDQSRTWNCPNVPNEAVIEADSGLSLLEQPLSGGGRQFTLTVATSEVYPVVARLGTNGVVLAAAHVDGFQFWATTQTYIKVLEVYPDGSVLYEELLVMSPLPPDMTIQLSFFSGGVMFEDGTTTKTLTAADFDSSGQYRLRYIQSGSGHLCRSIKIYQNGVLVGTK